MTHISCTADTRTRQITCGQSGSGSASASFTAVTSTDGNNADVILGGQGTFLQLVSSNVVYAGDVFSFNTTVQNLIGQKLGTTDGTTLDPTGVRVFFESPPVATSGNGTIDFINPVGGGSLVDGYANFTASNQPYYQYNEVLATGQTSSPKQWRIHIPSSVTTFSFSVYVSTPVQFPTGWIDVAPTTLALRATQTGQLTPTVRDVVGRTLTGQTTTWGTNAAGVATVDAAGLVTAVADGSATITATSTTRTGTSAITVASASAANTTITGVPNSLTVGGTSTITVQAKTPGGTNMTIGGDVVVLNASAGTLSAVTDNNNGTYTATLSTTTAQTIGITGTINSATIGNPGSVTFVAASPNSITINTGDAQTAAVGGSVATAPSVLVKDQFNNVVPNATVTFSVTGGGGSGTSLTPSTDASGIATVGSWTLGAGGAGCAAATITSCSRNTLHAVASGGTSPALDFKAYVPPIVPATATYQAIGNKTLSIAAANGALKDAFSINGSGANGTGAVVTVTTPAPSGSQSGTATIATDGGFSYLSSPSYVSSGVATEDFTYTVSDGVSTTNATATLQVNVPSQVWYVRSDYLGTSVGSDVQPFKNLSNAISLSTGATILVQASGTPTPAGTLNTGQTLIGSGATGGYSVALGSAGTYRNGGTNLLLLANGALTDINGLTVSSGNTVRGVALHSTGGTGLTASSFGTLTVSDVTIDGANQALNLSNGTLSGSFTSISSTGGTNNVNMFGIATSGTFAFGTGALSGATSDAFKISTSTGTFTYGGTISNTASLAVNVTGMTAGAATFSGSINPVTPAKGIAVTSSSGGSVTFSGAIQISSAGGAGVQMSSNTVVGVSFTGPLSIATSTGTGFISSAATLSVTGSPSTISTSSGQALSLTGSTIGASGVTFASVSSAGGVHAVSLNGLLGTGAINLNGGTFATATDTAVVVKGGANNITIKEGITHTSAAPIVSITGRSGGAIDVQGTLSCSTNCRGIRVTSGTAGSVTFSGSTKTLSTANNAAVQLSTNTGATIAFPNGGLNVTTTSGDGFNATGGGTVTVTTNGGAANKINSSTGTALLFNTTDIGANGLTFESINSTGSSANNGITLDHTGSLAGLTITGTGSAGSGGTIINKTSGADGSATQGSGIYLDNVVGVSLTRMQLNDFTNFAIRGTNVTGFSLTNSVISGTNGSTESGGGEGAIRFDGLFTSASFPTATITNSTIGGGYSENIRVKNSSGTLNRLIVDNVTLAALADNATHGGDAFIFEGLSGATMNLTLSNSNINGARGDLVNAVGHGGATMDVVLRQNRFYNLDANTVSGGGGVTLAGGDNGVAAFTFDVSCNRFKGTQGSSLNIFKSPSSTNSNLSGTVASNIIGVIGTAYSGGSSSSPALWVQSHGSGKVIVLIQNNTIVEYGEEAIDLQSNQGSSDIEATVYGNSIFSPSALATSGVTVEAGVISGDGGTIKLALGGSAGGVKNTLGAADPADVHDVLITKGYGSTGFSMYLNGVSNGTVASVIQAGNVGTTTVSVASSFANNTTNSAPQNPASVSSCSTPSPLMADISPVVEARDVRSVSDAELAAVAVEAVSRVMRVSPLGAVARFDDVSFAVTALPERQLAEATARRILVSPTAAGWGWFVDTTPSDDAEFEDVVNVWTGAHELRARRGGLAEGRMDLLTALVHELEHTLGARDLDPATARSDVMSATLPAGTRRTPAVARNSQGGSHE